MSSGRWLRELSPHQVIRNACCFPRSASITSHTKCMLLCPLGEHHLTCEMHAALPARRASPHMRAQHRHCLPRTPAFLATARAAPIASATLTSSIAFSLTSTYPTPPTPPPSLSLPPSPPPLPQPPCSPPSPRHHRQLPRRNPLFGAIEGAVLLLLLLCCPLAPLWRWCELQRKVARDLAQKREQLEKVTELDRK